MILKRAKEVKAQMQENKEVTQSRQEWKVVVHVGHREKEEF